MDVNKAIDLFNLKIDKRFPYHYIFSVANKVNKKTFDAKVQYYIKHGPICFTNSNVVDLYQAIQVSRDKMFKSTIEEGLEMYDVTSLVTSLSAMLMSARCNDCTLHHISSEIEISETLLLELVEKSSTSKIFRKILSDSLIKGG